MYYLQENISMHVINSGITILKRQEFERINNLLSFWADVYTEFPSTFKPCMHFKNKFNLVSKINREIN